MYSEMQFPATREQIRELDRIAIEEYGVRGLILMENAGRSCAREAAEFLGDVEKSRVVVFCGKGNNGGDGFVVARHLTNWGAEVQTFLINRTEDMLQKTSDAAVNLHIALNMGIPISETPDAETVKEAAEACAGADLIVDAMLGTGIQGEVREPFLTAIESINEVDCPKLAVDVPSGLDCNTGEALGAAVRAERTMTFGLPKRGFENEGAAEFTGEVSVAEISIPRRVVQEMVARWRSEGE